MMANAKATTTGTKAVSTKPQIILRVDDVGRKPGDSAEKGTDGELDYFFDWREACGLASFPVVYGVTPTWLRRAGRDRLLKKLSGIERVALHGWDHKRGLVTQDQMRVGAMLLNTNIYIPPYNEYDAETMQDWYQAGGRYFLGGYAHTADHPYQLGSRKLYHVPAWKILYGHAEKLPTNFETILPTSYPVVATLHVPWDKFEHAQVFVNAVRPYLVTIDRVAEWVETGSQGKGAKSDGNS